MSVSHVFADFLFIFVKCSCSRGDGTSFSLFYKIILYIKFCKVDPLQFRMMYYSYFYEQKLLQVVSIEKNTSDCAGASMPLSAQTIGCSAHLSRFNVKTLLYA